MPVRFLIRGSAVVGSAALLALALGACALTGAVSSAALHRSGTALRSELASAWVAPAYYDVSHLEEAPVSASSAGREPVVVLMYHHVMPNPNNDIAVSPAMFDRQMKFLHDTGRHPVTIAQLTAFLQMGRPLPEKPVLITFDDDRMNQLTYAVPILKKYGFTATFFVVKKWIDGPSKWFMHVPQLRQLVADGYDVESHTEFHTFIVSRKGEDYATMKKRLWDETYGMRVWLQDTLHVPATAIAYPGGVLDRFSPRLVREAGYQLAFTTQPGLVRYQGQSESLLCRYNTGARGLRFSSFVAIFSKARMDVGAKR